jgi:succinoglycan biosynthesis protein ExoA
LSTNVKLMWEEHHRERPVVSVILPVLNEARYLKQSVSSLLTQDAPDFDLEVLIIDANSNDGSRELVARIAQADSRVRLLTNENLRTPFAFNIGLREARGEYVAILGAHTLYEKDYISVCLHELLANGAVGCSGRVVTRPPEDLTEAFLVCWALGHRFGSSGKSFRTQLQGFAETIPYPIMSKRVLLEVGGYDEGMLRNQDNDMNRKLRINGYKLYCTWKTSCVYHTPANVKALMRYAFNNGFWNVISLRDNFGSMGMRHFVPFVFLVALLSSLALLLAHQLVLGSPQLLFAAPLLLTLGLHLFTGFVVGLTVSIRQKTAAALLLPTIFLALHLSYGWGTLWGFVTNAKKPVTAKGNVPAAV